MKEGPDIAYIAALIGDPARANILTALMTGKALTATELAIEAAITAQTASSHLRKLLDGGLIAMRAEGRHRYFTLAGEDVAAALEGLMGLSAAKGLMRTRTGPKDPALRRARVCYNHLAGDMGVALYQSMQAAGCFAPAEQGLHLTQTGRDLMTSLGLDLQSIPKSTAPLCRECLDWSARRSHLAGRLGRGLLSHFLQQGWVRRSEGSRVVNITAKGTQAFSQHFDIA